MEESNDGNYISKHVLNHIFVLFFSLESHWRRSFLFVNISKSAGLKNCSHVKTDPCRTVAYGVNQNFRPSSQQTLHDACQQESNPCWHLPRGSSHLLIPCCVLAASLPFSARTLHNLMLVIFFALASVQQANRPCLDSLSIWRQFLIFVRYFFFLAYSDQVGK